VTVESMTKTMEPTARHRPERAATRIAREIVSDIQKRQLRPGTQLDPEHIMIAKFGVARATVREALRFLEMQGVLRIKAGPGGGPVVNVPNTDHLKSALSLQLQFANATFRSVSEARAAIYPVLAAFAAKNASFDDIRALHECNDRLIDTLKDPIKFRYELRRFQELVAAASKQMVLGYMVNVLHRLSEALNVRYDIKRRRAGLNHMKNILEAIEKGASDFARAETERMVKASRKYWEETAADVMNAPVSWTGIDGSS